MELKEGMYVRTRYGIAKITILSKTIGSRGFYLDREIMDCNEENWKSFCTIHDIIGEPSYNIIDLIEVGDYVNGGRVFLITDGIDKHLRVADEKGTWGVRDIYEEDIKSIVTKEMFANAEYKVETD